MAHQVTLDKDKEEFVELHHIDSMGAPFRLLGPIVDPKLLMAHAVQKVCTKAKAKLQALLRMQHMFSFAEMVQQYKCHVLSALESFIPVVVIGTFATCARHVSQTHWCVC